MPTGMPTGTTTSDAGGPPPPPHDGGGPPPPQDSGMQSSAPTWTQLYDKYLASGTVGQCGGCHSSMHSASGSYSYMQQRGQIPGIGDPAQSCLTWLGGNMPPGGPSSTGTAAADFEAWKAAGALNN
jgi:hypothetical protein